MKSRDLIESLVAVLGIQELIIGAHALSNLIPFNYDSTGSTIPLAIVCLTMGVVLIRARVKLADRLAPKAEVAATDESSGLLETLLAVAGVYFAVKALADASLVVAVEYFAQSQPMEEVWPPRIEVLVEFALGLGLAFGRSGIATALRAGRTLGRGRAAV